MRDKVILFARYTRRRYFGQDSVLCLCEIMLGLTAMFGSDDALKAKYIRDHCPRLSRAMMESFKEKIEISNMEHLQKGLEPDPVHEWMNR